jgi:hemoglobin
MKRAAVTCVAWTALIFGMQALPVRGEEAASPKPPTLYQRLGSYDGLAALFDDTAPRLSSDPQFARFFSGHATDSDIRQRQRLLELLCQDAGGPCFYTGRSLKTAHKGLGITEADWSAFEKHLSEAMDHLKIGAKEQEEVVALMRRYKGDIVEKP